MLFTPSQLNGGRSAKAIHLDPVLSAAFANGGYSGASEIELLELYALSQTVYTCANIRAENVAAVPMRVVDANGKPLAAHPIAPVFAAMSNYKDAAMRTELSMVFTGANVTLPQPNFAGIFTRWSDNLRWLNPRIWTRRIDIQRGLIGFNIMRTPEYGDLDNFIPIEHTIYFQGIDLLDDFDAVSPAEVAYNAAMAQNETWQTLKSTMENRAVPATILQATQDSANAFRSNPEAPKTLAGILDKVFRGSKNTGKTLVSPDRLEAVQLQQEIEKMAIEVISPEQRQAIAEAMQVPDVLIRFSGATFENADAAVQFWYRNWLKPRCEWYAQGYSRFFTKWMGEPVYIEADFTDIIQEDLSSFEQATVNRLNAGIITLNECRRELKLEPLADGDVFYLPSSSIQVPADQVGVLLGKPSYLPFGNPQITVQQSGELATGAGIDVPPIPPEPIDLSQFAAMSARLPEAIHREIEIAARKGAAFVPHLLPAATSDYIKSMGAAGVLRDEITVAAKTFYLSVFAAKALAQTQAAFITELSGLLERARTDEATSRQFSAKMRSLLNQYGRRAYMDGLRDGGVDDPELSEDDGKSIARMLSEQSGYVSGLLSAIYKDGRVTDAQADLKPDIWFNMSIKPFYNAGLESAAADAMFEFGGEDGEETCPDCQTLKGQTHRFKAWKKRDLVPPTSRTQCKGFQCKHRLVPAFGKRASGVWLGSKSDHDHEGIIDATA